MYPLHYQFGFTIPKAWVIRERNEFVWIVSYDGPEDWDAKQAAYYGSPERAAVDPVVDPAQYMPKQNDGLSTRSLPGNRQLGAVIGHNRCY